MKTIRTTLSLGSWDIFGFSIGFRVQIWGLGFSVWGLGFRVTKKATLSILGAVEPRLRLNEEGSRSSKNPY